MKILRIKPYLQAFHEAGTPAEARKRLNRFRQQDPLVERTLKSAVVAAGSVSLLLFYGSPRTWAWGFLMGALLSLFSVMTLAAIVPILIRPHASPYVKGLLMLTLLLKLPLYVLVLSLANTRHGVEPMAVGGGLVLVPMVLTLRTLATLLLEGAGEPRKTVGRTQRAIGIPRIVVPSLPEVEPQPQSVQPVRERA